MFSVVINVIFTKMKCSIPEISWHNREPVLSIHLHPIITKFYKLVTGGADHHVIVCKNIVKWAKFNEILLLDMANGRK